MSPSGPKRQNHRRPQERAGAFWQPPEQAAQGHFPQKEERKRGELAVLPKDDDKHRRAQEDAVIVKLFPQQPQHDGWQQTEKQ